MEHSECFAISRLELLIYVFACSGASCVTYADMGKFEHILYHNVTSYKELSPRYCFLYILPFTKQDNFSHVCLHGTIVTDTTGYELYGYVESCYIHNLMKKYNDNVFSNALVSAYREVFENTEFKELRTVC